MTTHAPTPRAEERLSLETLSARSDIPIRTIRYYIQRGLLTRPLGEKKGAYYVHAHLETLLQIRRWIAAGTSLDGIHERLNLSADAQPKVLTAPPPRRLHAYELAPGISIQIDTQLAKLSEQQIKHLLAAATQQLHIATTTHQEKD